jgi:polysaccharide deacetylase family protein (PEP-CTERM system associated)
MKHNPAIMNALTVDVEDYFQVSAFSSCISRSEWDVLECRVEKNVNKILELFDRFGVKATFFTLGWIAERYPAMVRRIVDGGHELASHGYGHERIDKLLPVDFLQDIAVSKKILEDISGYRVLGYRAPSFSIGEHSLWAHDVLLEAGYKYSSSVYPVVHDHYGLPSAPRFPYRVATGRLLEIPPATIRLGWRNVPSGGGGYFRFFPYGISRWMLRHVNEKENLPAVFYFHPWELDVGQPRVVNSGMRGRFRHYLNIDEMEGRLIRLLGDFSWGRMDAVFMGLLE